jgi:hypothetical protein
VKTSTIAIPIARKRFGRTKSRDVHPSGDRIGSDREHSVVDRSRGGAAREEYRIGQRLSDREKDQQVEKAGHKRGGAHQNGTADHRPWTQRALPQPDSGDRQQRRQRERAEWTAGQKIRSEAADECPPDGLSRSGGD